jgi:hypothetical protein
VGDVVYVDPAALQQLKATQAGQQQGMWPMGDVIEVDEISSKATVRLQVSHVIVIVIVIEAVLSYGAIQLVLPHAVACYIFRQVLLSV